MSVDQDNDQEYRDHVEQANRWLGSGIDNMDMIRAQVHATLAPAAAVRELDVSTYEIGTAIREH